MIKQFSASKHVSKTTYQKNVHFQKWNPGFVKSAYIFVPSENAKKKNLL